MLTTGTLLQNRYRILSQIGGGGMGQVYLAEDTRLPGRQCAVKEMSPAQLAPQDRNWAIGAFKQEAQMLARLSHPGLTAVTDCFPKGGNWYLVMDYVVGETLKDRLERAPGGRLSLDEALNVVRQLCNVLEYLHGQSPPVVFRDLKPGNVMLTPQGEVKLIDFGIARFFKPGQTRDTVSLGTPGYAAPEQYGGAGQSDPRTDIYSLGALLLQLVTGYDPTTATTPFPLPSPGSLMRGLPTHVEATIVRATQMHPDRRYRSVQELRQELFPPTGALLPQAQPSYRPPAVPPHIPPPPPPPVEPTVERLPSYISITLSCTLNEAVERVSQECRRGLIRNILHQILDDDPIEGRSMVLVGYPGIGITTIIKQLKRDIIREHRGRAMVAHVGLSGGPHSVDPAEILRELERGRGNLKFRLQKAILRACRRYDQRTSLEWETSRRLKAGLPIQFTLSVPLLGTLTLGEPIEYESVVTKKSLPPEAESSIASGQQEALRALINLVDYLIGRGVRLTLVLDKVQDIAVLEPLRRLIVTPGINTLITANEHDFDFEQWQSSGLIQRVYYIHCLWGIAQEVCDHLLHNRPERDSREVCALVKYLEFYGRGIPQKIIETLEQFYVPPQRRVHNLLWDAQPLLNLPQDRFHEIMSIARVQTALNWDRIFQDTDGRILLRSWSERESDQAKMEVYALVDWVLDKARKGERFSTATFQERAFSSSLPLSTTRLVVRNLVEILEELGARTTTRGLDVTGLLYLSPHELGA